MCLRTFHAIQDLTLHFSWEPITHLHTCHAGQLGLTTVCRITGLYGNIIQWHTCTVNTLALKLMCTVYITE
jgi:hypothetical protein